MQDAPKEMQPPQRMTDAQRDKLWDLCGRYRVPFREDDYYESWFSQNGPINYEGWIGGEKHQTGNAYGNKSTIYIMVEPDGTSHS